MTEFIMTFEEALNKAFEKHPDDPTLRKRLLLLILAPLLRLPTINALCNVLQVEKDVLYRTIGVVDEHHWLKLLRVFAYARVIQVIEKNQTLHPSNRSRNRLTIDVDDTGCSKSGKRMPLVGYLWDAVLKRVTLGTQALYFYVIVGDEKIRFPLDVRLCRGKGRKGRPTKSRHEMVVEMLHDFHRALTKAHCPVDHLTFVADSWFNSGKIYTAARECGFSFTCRGKANFVFTINGERIKAADLLAQSQSWRTSATSGDVYARYVAVHQEFGTVVLTLFQNQNKLIYVISTNPDHTSPKVIADYKLRWPVEVFFKDSKQALGLKKFAYRSKNKLYGHFVLRALTFHLLEFIRIKLFKRWRTIGQCAEWFYYQVFLNPTPSEDKLGLHKLKAYIPDFRGFI